MSQTFLSQFSHCRPLATILAVASGLGGCASIPHDIANFSRAEPIPEVEAVPFFSQEKFQCGPAALTTVLVHSGIDVTLDTITELTYLPGRQGSLQTELLATARQYDRLPYELGGTMDALAAEVRAGRPVLILQNLGISLAPRWHYAVVVGIDMGADEVILRSGTDRRRATRMRTFLRTWQRSNYWAMVLLRPGEFPERLDKTRYFKAAAGLESAARYRAAQSAWVAALTQWPDDPVALFGEASSAYQLGEFVRSEQAYRSLLKRNPGMHAARNNLAYVLAEQGKLEQAVAEVRIVLASIAADDPLRDEFEASLEELECGLSDRRTTAQCGNDRANDQQDQEHKK